jgi:hypothetical protein
MKKIDRKKKKEKLKRDKHALRSLLPPNKKHKSKKDYKRKVEIDEEKT